MAKKILIDAAHPEETRVVVMRGNKVEDFDYESAAHKQLRGNIYLAKVTRVEPSLQAAFVDYGGNRHGFLAFSEIHPDYYQIPLADRQALLDEELEDQDASSDDDDDDETSSASAADVPEDPSNGEEAASDEDDDDDDDDDERDAAEEDDETVSAAGEAEAEAEEEPEQGEAEEAASDDAAEDDDAGNGDGDDDSDDDPDDPKIALLEVEDPEDEFVASEEVSAAEDSKEPEDAPDDGDTAEETAAGEATDAPEADAADGEEEDEKPKARSKSRSRSKGKSTRSRRSRKSKADADDDEADDNGNGDTVDTVGAEDALEEVPQRRRKRRREYKIQEVIKRRQIILVQVVKEERGNKGAALTTYLSLAGRYCVLMPNTSRGGGISRKITDAQDRKRLKEVATGLDIAAGMGLIVRTAGANRTKAEIKRDFDYLLRLWENVRDLTLQSNAPCLVYEEGSLIKRSIRDLYDKDVDSIEVEGEAAYREAKDLMKMLMPSHAKNVKAHKDSRPLLSRNQIESQLDALYSPQVTLPSGGYIVINQTEALVAIDVNSGKSTREHNIENTALRTNQEAAEEVARQMRLRDLAGLIVIDFIDMEERRNNRAVERKLKDALKNDRARIQVGRISHFGLLEMSRQRMRTGVLEGSTIVCPHCEGQGFIRSVESCALSVLRGAEEHLMGRRNPESIVVNCEASVAAYILNQKRDHLHALEATFSVVVFVEPGSGFRGSEFKISKTEGPTRRPSDVVSPLSLSKAYEDAEEEDAVAEAAAADDDTETEEEKPRRRKRRRGRRGGRGKNRDRQDEREAGEAPAEAASEADGDADGDDEEGGKKRTRKRRSRGGLNRKDREEVAAQDDEAFEAPAPSSSDEGEDPWDTTPKREERAKPEPAAAEAAPEEAVASEPEEAKEKPKPKRRSRKKAEAEAEASPEEDTEKPKKAPAKRRSRKKAEAPDAAPEEAPAATNGAADCAPAEPEREPQPMAAEAPPADPDRPKRSGWWQKR
ncbi:MAG: Rne/Rng family ribonuclease [Pseudomonadota bacterium]